MKGFFQRLVTAYRVILVKKVIVIETWRDASDERQEFLRMFSTMEDEKEQLDVLANIAKSLEYDYQEKQRNLANLESEKLKSCQ